MEAFSALLVLCAGNSPVTGKFPSQRPVTRIFYVSSHLRLNKRLNKHSRRWWFETPSQPLWRHCNGGDVIMSIFSKLLTIKHLTARPFGWVQTRIQIMSLSLQWCMHHHVILDRIISSALDYTLKSHEAIYFWKVKLTKWSNFSITNDLQDWQPREVCAQIFLKKTLGCLVFM